MADIPGVLSLIRNALQLVAGYLTLTAYQMPSTTVVPQNATYDFIVIGGGTSGCIVATRLAELPNLKVLMIEAGGNPPFLTQLSGTIVVDPNSNYDYGYEAENDHRIAQFTTKKTVKLTSAKVLGGCSSIMHGPLVGGNKKDYDNWAKIVKNESWNFDNLHKYMKDPENMVESEILSSEYGDLYGRGGYVTLTQEHEGATDKYLDAFKEIGYPTVVDINGHSVGYAEPVLYISKEGARQSTAQTYLRRDKTKSNLDVLKNTDVIKILFDNRKNAIGVVARNESGEFEIHSKKGVVVSAGALNSPKILMLSGIGPKKHLQTLGIKVLSDLPVGKNLQDLPTVIFGHQMEASDKPAEDRDPHKYAAPAFVGYNAINKSQDVPDYLTLNLIFPQSSATNIQLMTSAFYNLNNDIAETLANASVGHEVLLTALSLLNATSRGSVELRSTNFTDPPRVTLNLLSTKNDLTRMAKFLRNYAEIQKSTFFKSVNATFIELNVGCGAADNSLKYWKCFALGMTNTFWQYVGTCAVGSVVGSDMKVKGVGNLWVADASIFPNIIGGYMNMPVMAIAEKAADMIKTAISS